MTASTKISVQRQTVAATPRTAEQLAELREVRERFQRTKPGLDQILADTGQAEAIPLGDYLRAKELVGALRKERERQQLTLAQLAGRTGYDAAVLSRLLTGRQANTTLATIGRIASALGKEVVHALRDISPADKSARPGKRKKTMGKQ